MRKHVLQTLGLALMAALALAAFMAAGAQAETKVGIKVLGSEELNATITGTGLLGRLLIASLNTELHCNKATVVSAQVLKLEAGKPLSDADATVLFEECKFFSITPKLEELPCLLLVPNTTTPTTHVKATALIYALLHKGTVYAIAQGTHAAGEVFTLLKIHGSECTLPSPVNITGLTAFNVTQGQAVNVLLTPGNEALQKLLIPEATHLKFGKNLAIIDEGVAHATLLAPHLGCEWGAL